MDPRRPIGKELERERLLTIRDTVDGQAQGQQRVEQTTLGHLEAVPGGLVSRTARSGMTRVRRHDRQRGLSSSSSTAQLQTSDSR